jgi:hypothetical protein
MTQCQFCGCQEVAYQWFGGAFIFTCGTWSGSTSIRGDRCYENEIAALKAQRVTLLEALQDCAEALAAARGKLGMSGEGDHKDHKADALDDIGSNAALLAARAALKLPKEAKR